MREPTKRALRLLALITFLTFVYVPSLGLLLW